MPPPIHVPRVRSFSLLLVDDEPVVRETMKEFLERGIWNAKVQTAGSAEEALALVKGRKFDLVLADHRLDGMTGMELLAQLEHEAPEMLRVLLTAATEPELAERLEREVRLHGYVQKPYSPKNVVELVRELLYAPHEGRPKVSRREVLGHMARGRTRRRRPR